MKLQELTIDDVLEGGPVMIYGVNVDCHVSVSLTREHDNSYIEIECIDIRGMHIVTDIGNVPLDPAIMYDNKMFYSHFKTVVEVEAVKQAKKSFDWKQVEYEAY